MTERVEALLAPIVHGVCSSSPILPRTRAAMIWHLIDSSGVGGAERHIETLASSLQRRGLAVQVVLVADHGNRPWQQQLAGAGIRYTHLDGRFSTLVGALRRARPALLHTHGYKAGILGRLAARLAGVPVVSTFHSGERGPFPDNASWRCRSELRLSSRRPALPSRSLSRRCRGRPRARR